MSDSGDPKQDKQHELEAEREHYASTPNSSEWLDPILEVMFNSIRPAVALPRARKAILTHLDKIIDQAIVAYRDRVSTDNRPLSAPPLVKKMLVPCPDCKAEEYYDWYLYPHQVYNSFMPEGIGHYCFPCFCKRVVGLSNELIKAKTEAYKTGYLEGAVTTYNEYTAQLAQLNPTETKETK